MNIINIIRIDQDNADLEAVSILASTASNSGWRRRWWWWASNCLSSVCLMRLARAIRGPSSQPQDERDFLCFAGLRHRHPTTEPTKAQSERTSDSCRRNAPLNPDLMNLLKVSVVNDSYCVLIRCDINGERTLIHGMTISQSTPGKVNQWDDESCERSDRTEEKRYAPPPSNIHITRRSLPINYYARVIILY